MVARILAGEWRLPLYTIEVDKLVMEFFVGDRQFQSP